IWSAASYTHTAWPSILAWVAAFVLMQLAFGVLPQWRSKVHIHAAALLFFMFPVLAAIEPAAASAPLLFGALLILLALLAAAAIRLKEGLAYFIVSFFAITTEAVWSARYMTTDRLYAGLAVYGIFGLLF